MNGYATPSTVLEMKCDSSCQNPKTAQALMRMKYDGDSNKQESVVHMAQSQEASVLTNLMEQNLAHVLDCIGKLAIFKSLWL